MAIIYTYPTKATPNANDLILISDSQDDNKTKQVTIASLPGGSGSGVSSVTSTNAAITVTDVTTTPVLTSVAYSGGTGIGHVPTGSGNSATVYLDGTGNWSTPSPALPLNSVQFNNASAFGGDANLTFTGSGSNPDTLTLTDTLDIKGDGTNPGTLNLYCEDITTPHAVSILGPVHAGATPYSIRLPKEIATQTAYSSGGRVLESDASGALQWIATPTGGPGTGTQYSIPFWSTASVLGDSILSQDASATKVVLAATKKLEIPNDGTTTSTAINFGTANTGINGYGTTGIGLVSGGQSRIEVTTGLAGGQDITLTGLTQSDGGLRFGSGGSTLDSYQEGTWIPSLTFGGGQTTPVLNTASGNYIIIGKYVYANFYVVVQAGTQYSGSLPRISLPVAAASHNGGILMMNNAYTTASQNTSIILGSVVGGMSIVGLKTMDVSGSEVRIQNLGTSPLTYYNNAVLSGSIIYLKN